ncbi:hypothetical protein SPSIL_056030 [Sporomusa silvacetica DSM 10669]|uniref:Uncharacterized protein n=1 Tax=Sporomusa silvacetica DSM 10669 TaxID=1123289 RepID=A0ABZ3IUH7_9FIRM|nr:hypothetical protein SPSIL_57320 [Sporomusa silvacetica DSM 10669]
MNMLPISRKYKLRQRRVDKKVRKYSAAGMLLSTSIFIVIKHFR